MQAICCYYNPLGYKTRLKNFCKFRDKIQVPLRVIECVFSGQKPVIEDAVHIFANANNYLWQKERLLNILLEEVTDDKVVWLDTDIVFQDDSWFVHTDKTLDAYEVVQPYSLVQFLDQTNRRVIKERPSAAWVYERERVRSGAPGFAWAVRRDLIEDGLYDRSIIGNGDRLMFNRWVDDRVDEKQCESLKQFGIREWGWEFVPPIWHRDVMKWGRAAEGIAAVEGVIHHLWHGDRSYRRYNQRAHQLGRFYQFKPSEDITLDSNQLWRTEREEILWYVKAYLEGRREDGEVLML